MYVYNMHVCFDREERVHFILLNFQLFAQLEVKGGQKNICANI